MGGSATRLPLRGPWHALEARRRQILVDPAGSPKHHAGGDALGLIWRRRHRAVAGRSHEYLVVEEALHGVLVGGPRPTEVPDLQTGAVVVFDEPVRVWDDGHAELGNAPEGRTTGSGRPRFPELQLPVAEVASHIHRVFNRTSSDRGADGMWRSRAMTPPGSLPATSRSWWPAPRTRRPSVTGMPPRRAILAKAATGVSMSHAS